VRFGRLIGSLRRLVELGDDASDKLGGEWILDRSYVASFVGRTLARAREIVFDSAVLTGDESAELYARLDAVRGSLDRLMAARQAGSGEGPTVVPPGSAADEETTGGAHLEEPEYRLLHAAIRRLALTADPTPGPASSPTGPRLAEVVQEAHERALRSFEGLHFRSWGRRAGRPLVGSGLPGPVRVVDVGGGTAPPGEGEWRSTLSWRRIRSSPLRALLEPPPGTSEAGLAPSRGPQSATLAIITEEHATVDVAWTGGGLLVDACLGEHAAANFVYCTLRGDPPGSPESLRIAVTREGFRFFDLGKGLTVRLQGRDDEETRRTLGRLGGALGALLQGPVDGSGRPASRARGQPEAAASFNGK